MNPSTDRHDGVQEFYETNSGSFRRYGHGKEALHRAVWAPGVKSRSGAFHFIDERILSLLPHNRKVPRVLDLGCGLGSTLCYIASQSEIDGVGITISPSQASGAREYAESTSCRGYLRFLVADFHSLPSDLRNFDLACSIEAFVHSTDAALFLRQAAKVLSPGGILVICDDFLSSGINETMRRRCEKNLEKFRWGWHIGTLLTVDSTRILAAQAGFELIRRTDLSAFLELGRPRDRLIALFAAAATFARVKGQRVRALAGGDALQRSLRSGILGYHLLVFRRGPEAGPV